MTTPQLDQPLPSFSLRATIPGTDGSITETTLSNADFSGQPWVLFVYPKDATPGCTIEVCGFRDLFAEFDKIGAKITGLSRDTIGAHRKFIQSQNLPYTLLADADKTLLSAWGLIVPKTMYGKPVTGVSRVTYVMDGAGIVRRIYENVTPLGHAAEVLQFIQSLK